MSPTHLSELVIAITMWMVTSAATVMYAEFTRKNASVAFSLTNSQA